MKNKKVFFTTHFIGFFLMAGFLLALGAHDAAAANACNSNSLTEFCNPLNFTSVEGLLGGLLSAIQKIIVVLALVFITIGAMMILTSAGNSGMVEKGKGAITMALVGLALGVAAPSLLKELAGIIGWGDAGAVAGALTLSEIAIRVLNFLLGIAGILALVMIVIGATLYLTSAGDEHRAEQGKEIFKFSLIGLILAMSSMILVTQISKFFITTPSSTSTSTNNTTIITSGNTTTVTPVIDNMPDVTDTLTNTPPAINPTVTNCQSAGGYADEVCTVMDPDPTRRGQYTAPAGKDCWWRNVCPTGPRMEGCCRPEIDTSGL